MPAVPFYNDNAARAYPFVDQEVTYPRTMTYSEGADQDLPDSTIVDFVCITGVNVNFDLVVDNVYLYEIRRSGDYFVFTFKLTGAGSSAGSLQFYRHITAGEFIQDHVEIIAAASSSSTSADCGGMTVEAWLTTGDLTDLLALLDADGEYLRRADQEIKIEPARIQSLYNGFVNSINLANARRTIAPDPCAPVVPPTGYVVNERCMSGIIKFKEGYNAVIRQIDSTNTLEFGAKVGAGAGEPCEEVPLFAGEAAAAGSTLLSGGPKCDDLIKTINGIPGPDVPVVTGMGVSLLIDQASHTISIDPSMHGLAICLPSESSAIYEDYYA